MQSSNNVIFHDTEDDLDFLDEITYEQVSFISRSLVA